MPDSIHEISRLLGGLQAEVKNLTDTWRHQDREASEGRKRLHDKVDALASQQGTLANKVEQQTKELAEVKPAIKRFETERQRREGANSLLKLLWVGIVAFATGLGYVAHELLLYFWPPKHP